MADPLVGVTLNHLRGHEGAEALAQVLQVCMPVSAGLFCRMRRRLFSLAPPTSHLPPPTSHTLAMPQAPLMRHATSFGGGKSYISFPARNRQAAENSSANTAGDLRGEMSAPKPMSKLDSLAHAALLTDEMENGSIRRGRKEENAEEADAGTQVSREGAAQAASRARCETLRERLRKLEEELRKLEEELPVRESRITSLQGQQQARARGSSEQAAGGCRD